MLTYKLDSIKKLFICFNSNYLVILKKQRIKYELVKYLKTPLNNNFKEKTIFWTL